MLGIHRHDLDVETAGICHKGAAGADKAFLVGEGDPPARLQRRMSGSQTGCPADGGKHGVGVTFDSLENSGMSCAAADPSSSQSFL
jgi:hypothetical protein